MHGVFQLGTFFYTKLAYLVVVKTCYIRLSIPVFGKTGSRKKKNIFYCTNQDIFTSNLLSLIRDLEENKPPYD
jgi:hypothetical protein